MPSTSTPKRQTSSTLRRSERKIVQSRSYILVSDSEEEEEEDVEEVWWRYVPDGNGRVGKFIDSVEIPIGKPKTIRNAFTILAEASKKQQTKKKSSPRRNVLTVKKETNSRRQRSESPEYAQESDQSESEDEGPTPAPSEYSGSEKENDVIPPKTPKKNKRNGNAFAARLVKTPRKKTRTSTDAELEEPPEKRTKYWQPPTRSADPPLHKIKDMFADMVAKTPALKDVARHLNGRKLRFATMCSGTESPLLALRMITAAMQNLHGETFEVEHIFSCEIEPYKQKYIDRNFKPAKLFRDIRELGGDEATTCYGSKVSVPGDCDLLVAGTSCVDYSGLNNNKKTIDEAGESGQTFWAMMEWVRKHRPKIVVVENIFSAPWAKMTEAFRKAGYVSEFSRFDTKEYYIPHTRVRGYLIAFDTNDDNKQGLGKEWEAAVRSMKRPASCTMESFLLDPDDPRVLEARERMEPSEQKSTPWTASQVRHEKERSTWGLGESRPLLNWTEGGKLAPPNWSNMEWMQKQAHRVLDVIEINHLQNAIHGVDTCYKTKMLNLSQNVDRNIESSKSGICSCLTPTGIPYMTTLGRPLTGYEALALQGLPLEMLLLTRETDSQLMNLAGNAMTSTVVGACMVAGLITGLKTLPKSYPNVIVDTREETAADANRIVGCDLLSPSPLNLTDIQKFELEDLLEQARRCARLCECEGRNELTRTRIQRCKDCGDTACVNCGKNPDHNYEIKDEDNFGRILPTEFENKLKAALPMAVSISLGEIAKPEGAVGWEQWLEGASKAFGELRFKSLKRGKQWLAYYESPDASLELTIDPSQPEWRLFYRVPLTEPAISPLRKMFSRPVARMRIDGSTLLSGTWEACLPVFNETNLQVKGSGERVKSWRNSLGLLRHQEETTWSELEVTSDSEDLQGNWTLLPKCGTACRSLHRKGSLFLFLDPSRSEDPKEDSFVVSPYCRRYGFSEVRPIVGKMAPGWLPPRGDSEAQNVTFTGEGSWTKISSTLEPAALSGIHAFTDLGSVSKATTACRDAPAFLTCQAPGSSKLLPEDWTEIEEVHQREIFSEITWLTERTKSMAPSGEWVDVTASHLGEGCCQTCAPPPPPLRWYANRQKKYVPVEDPVKAGPYERSLKSRPGAWISKVRASDGLVQLQIGLNITTLCHRATATLGNGAQNVSWRLVADYVPPVLPKLERFRIKSNVSDSPSTQPPNFRLPLRKEQLRSLGWMLAQESGSGGPFVEEEVVEAVHEQMQWRVDVKATRENPARGGILADEVGYGKTATTLGLIDCQRQNYTLPEVTAAGLIPVKATLVIVPPHLTNQWRMEVEKFLGGSNLNIIEIKNMGALNSLTVRNIMDADLILMGSSCFKSDTYFENLAAFAGNVDAPKGNRRRHEHWLQETLKKLDVQVEKLKEEGAEAVLDSIRSCGEPAQDDVVAEESKRLKGAKLQAAEGKKRKRNDSGVSSVAAKKRRKLDPWRLSSRAVKTDWTHMHAPPIEMFHFQRTAVDEFTYNFNESTIHSSVVRLNASYKWVLSGTPPLGEFADVKNIAQYLGVNLGINHDPKFRKFGGAAAERSKVEAFQFFEAERTPNWHENRHRVAQRFLDKFMRQNVAEITEIMCEEHLLPVELPPAEMALYTELDHYLQSIDVFSRRNLPPVGADKADRINQAVRESNSSEEALLKCCSYFELGFDGEDTCEAVLQQRHRECELIKDEIFQTLSQFFHLRDRYLSVSALHEDAPDTGALDAFVSRLKTDQKDTEIASLLRCLIEKAEELATRGPDGLKEYSKKRYGEVYQKMRDLQRRLLQLVREALSRSRAYRFFHRIRTAQDPKAPEQMTDCPGCHKQTPFEQLAMASVCGHTGCEACVRQSAHDKEECVASGFCSASPKDSDVVVLREIRWSGEEDSPEVTMNYGRKMQALLNLISSIPEDEKAVVFVQFQDQLKRVAYALQEEGIPTMRLEGTKANTSKQLTEFQKAMGVHGPKVLLLEPLSESASGANIVNANHVVFFSSLLTSEADVYTACETQAIGRVRRFGQKKTVHVHRLMARKTVDVKIYEERTGRKV